MTLLDALHAELGADRVMPMPGWSERTRPGTFRPSAVQMHWTAARSSAARPAPSTQICMHGLDRPDLGYFLPGPLYHLLVGWDGRVRLIHRRVGNHSGRGSLAALRLAERGAVPYGYRPGADDATISALAWSVSIDYHPDQGAPPEAMLDGAARAAVAVHRFQGWDTARVYDHRHSTRRKIDVGGVRDLRPAIAARLAGGHPEEDDMIAAGTKAPQVRELREAVNRLIRATGGGLPDLAITDVYDQAAQDRVAHVIARLEHPGFAGPLASPTHASPAAVTATLQARMEAVVAWRASRAA